MTFCLFSLRLVFDRSKLEPLRDVSITRIGDTLSYGFPQTELLYFVQSLQAQNSARQVAQMTCYTLYVPVTFLVMPL